MCQFFLNDRVCGELLCASLRRFVVSIVLRIQNALLYFVLRIMAGKGLGCGCNSAAAQQFSYLNVLVTILFFLMANGRSAPSAIGFRFRMHEHLVVSLWLAWGSFVSGFDFFGLDLATLFGASILSENARVAFFLNGRRSCRLSAFAYGFGMLLASRRIDIWFASR